VCVCTRDVERHQALARELGAAWIGGAHEIPPEKLDGSMIFAPAGDIIPPALQALDKGATLVLGGIHMSPTPPIEYPLLNDERIVRSVANNTRDDGRAFLDEAAEANVRTSTTVFPLSEANDALHALQHDAFRGAAVLDCRA
jgi:propanol-preferring alcohol dehydrogenase